MIHVVVIWLIAMALWYLKSTAKPGHVDQIKTTSTNLLCKSFAVDFLICVKLHEENVMALSQRSYVDKKSM